VGPIGLTGEVGPVGPIGEVGPVGPVGPIGPVGPSSIVNVADFYGLMGGEIGQPNDNPTPILPANSVNFPNPLLNPYGTIQRVLGSTNQFILPAGGVFEITFQVGTQNTGELVIVLDGVEQLMSVIGKSGGGLLIGTSIITTPILSTSIVSINNPAGSDRGGLKIDNATGNLTQPLSCHLIIKQLQ
jgi:hypothetical protein